MIRLNLMSASALTACVVAVSATACAQELRVFNIAAGSLGDGLNQFAAQSGQQIFFTGDLVEGRRTPGLTGRLVPGAALNQLLAGTGLTWSETRPGVILLERAGRGTPGTASTVADIVVTGTLLRRSGELASPVLTLGRDDLDARGRGTIADTLRDLPQNFAGAGNPAAALTGADRAGSNAVFATGVNLRGLGPDATLVLINGRRLAGTGFRGEFADVSALPSGAVERVDVLLDGASALYGADAVAGVVNVIMRRSFEGQETRIRAAVPRSGGEDLLISHLAGRSWSSGSALISYEYQHTNAFSSLDRPYTADGDLRPFGGTDRRVAFGSPGNIVEFDAGVGVFVSRFAIRPGPSGTATRPADFVAGAANLQASTLGQDLTPETTRHSAYARIRQSVGDRLDLSSDLRVSQRDYSFAGAATATVFAVGRANPFFVSPTGAASHTLGYSFYGDLGSTRRFGSSRSLGFTAGGVLDLGRDWSLDAYLALAEERGASGTIGRVNSRYLNEALGNLPDDPATPYSAAIDGFFNPFGDGRANGPAVLNFIGSGFTRALDRSRASSVNMVLEGPLMTLPGGPVQAAFGVQARQESFSSRVQSLGSTVLPVVTSVPLQDRTITALFGEIRLPVVGEANARPGLRSLEVSLAGRVEDYDDFGTTTNPKVGIVWSPFETLSMRASWGTSFRAPGLTQLNDVAGVSTTMAPRADGVRILSLFLSGGNPDLEPETAETFTAGLEYRRPGGGVVALNLFDTEFTDRIAQPAAANITSALIDPALSSFITLVSPGTNGADLALVNSYVTRPQFSAQFPATAYGAIIDGRWVNSGAVRVRGMDLSVNWPILDGANALTLDASASYLFDYQIQTTPTSPLRDVLDFVNQPTRLRSRGGLTWSRGALGLAANTNYVSSYRTAAGRQIDDWTTVDVRATWSPHTGPIAGLQVALSAQNLFDVDPPFYDSPSGYGFDAAQASLLGRVVALQLIKRW